MGMFDYVDYTDNCPNCNNLLRGFQTKDLDNQLRHLKPVQVRQFWTECDKCKIWLEYEVIPEGPHRIVCTWEKIREFTHTDFKEADNKPVAVAKVGDKK